MTATTTTATTTIELDQKDFLGKLVYRLKCLTLPGDVLQARELEIIICEAFELNHVGDSNRLADGIKGNIQVSIKTRNPSPVKLKKSVDGNPPGRNFQSHPKQFLGPHYNKKQNKWTGGIEFVQRRQALYFDDLQASPSEIGVETLKQFIDNIKESFKKYNTCVSYEIIVVHGYDQTGTRYLVSIFWKEYEHIDPLQVDWIREGYGVSGYVNVGQEKHKITERVNGNVKRQGTCFKEFRDLTKYKDYVNINIPVPKLWGYDQKEMLAEIDLNEKLNGLPSNLFST
jgi:hypothetical protein